MTRPEHQHEDGSIPRLIERQETVATEENDPTASRAAGAIAWRLSLAGERTRLTLPTSDATPIVSYIYEGRTTLFTEFFTALCEFKSTSDCLQCQPAGAYD